MGVQINGDTGNISATKADYSGNVTIGGTLTYEDVTNVDSIGIVTARNGIEVGARPGVAASISVDGNMIVSGVSTFGGATSIDSTLYVGSDLTITDKIVHNGDTNTAIRFPAADTVSVETAGTERFRVDSDGNVSVGNNPTVASDTLFHVEKSGETNVIFEGDTSTLGARLTLKNNNTGASAKNQIDFADAGGQSTSSIQAYNTDQDNNYGYLTFHTRSASGTPPEERMRISKEGYVTKPNLPAFMVNGSPSHSNFTGYDNSVHSFGNVHYNNGSHYNNSTGRFTAPVAGFYWFSAGIWSNNSDETTGNYLLVLTRNDSDASNELQFAGCNHRYEKVQLTVSAGIDMTAGQTVRLWHNGSRISSTPRNYFSGYLVG